MKHIKNIFSLTTVNILTLIVLIIFLKIATTSLLGMSMVGQSPVNTLREFIYLETK